MRKDGMTDPAVAFDDFGHAFLVGEPLEFNQDKVGTSDDLTGLGMVVYRSTNGGVSWEQPIPLTTDTHDDKQWCAGDASPGSPYFGHVYVTWDGGAGGVEFARTTDHGGSWTGTAGQAAGTLILPGAELSDISVAADGTYLGPAGLFNNTPITRGARPGETILLFGTGFGPTLPQPPSRCSRPFPK